MKKVRSNFQLSDMYVQHYIPSNTKNHKTEVFTIPLYTNHICNNIQMLSKKATAEELDENNQKRLHKIVVELIYYDRFIDQSN